MSDEQKTSKTGWFKKGNRKVIAIATGSALVVGSVFGVQAFADSKTFSHMTIAASDGGSWHGMGRHKRHGHRHGGFERMSEADMEAKVSRIVRHAAVEIDATPEQEEKITALVTTVAKDLMPLRGEMRAMRKDIQDLLTADTVDRAALNTMRKERLAEMDRISETVLTAAADVADVLTVEQRKTLNDRIGQFTSGHRRGHGGWRRH